MLGTPLSAEPESFQGTRAGKIHARTIGQLTARRARPSKPRVCASPLCCFSFGLLFSLCNQLMSLFPSDSRHSRRSPWRVDGINTDMFWHTPTTQEEQFEAPDSRQLMPSCGCSLLLLAPHCQAISLSLLPWLPVGIFLYLFGGHRSSVPESRGVQTCPRVWSLGNMLKRVSVITVVGFFL